MSTILLGATTDASIPEVYRTSGVHLSEEPHRQGFWFNCGTNPSKTQTRVRSEGQYSKRKNLRRLRGFVIQDCGREFKVGFVETKDGKERMTQYFVPADFLKHAGVSKENQQFELDEVLTKYRDGSVAVAYHVKPCAAASEGFDDPLTLDAKHREKLAELLHKLGDAAA